MVAAAAVPAISGALVAMDPHTGRVLALVGGFSFAESQFDRAMQARRQPGSSFKPLIYTTALDNGYTPSSIIVDGPICISQGAGMPQWCPKNYEAGSAAGPSTLRFGIEKSRNLMTVRLANDMGMPIIVEYAQRFGVYDNLMPALSMALGAGETTLLRMVDRLFHDRQWRQADQSRPSSTASRIATAAPFGATTMRDCSQLRRAGMERPGRARARRRPPAGHRSDDRLSDDHDHGRRGPARHGDEAQGAEPADRRQDRHHQRRQGCLVHRLSRPTCAVGVYIGFDKPTPMGHGETGGNLAAPVVRDFLKEALADQPPVPFRAPPGVKLVRVNHKTGLPAGPGDTTAIMEAFKPGHEPCGAVAVDPEGFGDEMAGEPEMPQGAAPPPGCRRRLRGRRPPPPPGFPPARGVQPRHPAATAL